MLMVSVPKSRHLRLLVVVLIIVSLLPVISAGVGSMGSDTSDVDELRKSTDQVTFVSTQGGSTRLYDHAGKLAAIHTPSNQRIWVHEEYRRYMDIDPLDSNRLLFVAGERDGEGGFQRVAVVINWRTGEELRKFPVPGDTHDVDAMGNGQFAVADKANHSAYITNVSTNKTLWRYDFRNHFNSTAGDDPVKGDWTHLNDIDIHNNGELVLLSPRDYDRVILVNRSSKEIVWTLGNEDAHNILYEQHNPVLLNQSPPTTLVADSENNRIIEYQRQDESWDEVWRYEGDLHWPRDADRLPNSNTLIADTHNDRVLEVTPDGDTVWEHSISRSPYDVERLQFGNEPAGPSMTTKDVPPIVSPDSRGSMFENIISPYIESFNSAYQSVGAWIMPSWAGPLSFLGICVALLLVLGWIILELIVRLPIDIAESNISSASRFNYFAGGLLLVAELGMVPLMIGMAANTTILATISLVLFLVGVYHIGKAANSRWRTGSYRVLFAAKVLSLAAGVLLCAGLIVRAVIEFDPGPSYLQILSSLLLLSVISVVWNSYPRISAGEWVGFRSEQSND